MPIGKGALNNVEFKSNQTQESFQTSQSTVKKLFFLLFLIFLFSLDLANNYGMTLNLFFIVDGAVADLIDRYTLLLPIAMCINSANIWNHYFKKNLIYKYLILVNNKSYLREIKPLSLSPSLSQMTTMKQSKAFYSF